jgi:predicted transcriptional regulator of viral defense system
MTRSITELGPREVEFLARLSSSGRMLFTMRDAAEFWGARKYAREKLTLLESKGWVDRLEQGSYMVVPLQAGLERLWSEDALAVGTFLAPDGAAAYRSATRHWNWTTQLPSPVTFMTPRRRFNNSPTVLGVPYRFVLVRPDRLFGVFRAFEGGLPVHVTERERTIVDMMDRPDLCGGIAEVVEALRTGWPECDPVRVVEYVQRHGGGTVPKRLGFLVEQIGIERPTGFLPQLQTLMGAGMSDLERGGAKSGRYVRRWRLRVNTAGFDAADGGVPTPEAT